MVLRKRHMRVTRKQWQANKSLSFLIGEIK
nr:MAG TPA: hypothetical protein [Caudoviricetes sp.]DAM01709.1 MAG TPA: hypothetical protein [Caudoviricetes sp.]DAP49698.1 MAG TPA: hypothetical protein [Caudoviricetes sp.]